MIEQTTTELRLTRKYGTEDQQQSRSVVYSLAGEASTNPAPFGNGEMKTRTSWQKDKLVTLGTQTLRGPNGDIDMAIKEEFSLSKDGKELTVKSTRNTPRGEMTSKMVYRKQ